MMPAIRIIRILVIIQIFKSTCCQDGFSEQKNPVRLQQYTTGDGNTNNLILKNVQNDMNIQAVSSNSDKSNDDQQYLLSRSRKVYRIKNPFQSQLEESEKQQHNTEPQDSDTGASNHYASMQYPLPPREFLQQLRGENQYYQQTQISTPAPNVGYTATPLPQAQYQYSTVIPPYYQPIENNNPPNNQISLDNKISYSPTYMSSLSPYQYSTPNTFIDNFQSTASSVPSYLSTPFSNNYYSSQPSPYISSISPIYISSSLNPQPYVSSPFSIIHTGSPDYNNRVTTPNGNNNDARNYENNHYSFNKYSLNIPQQYPNEYTTTTTTPSTNSEQLWDSWQSNINSGINAAPKSLQENQHTNYQTNQQETKLENDAENVNSETHRASSMAAANNPYVNYLQPDGQVSNNLKLRSRELEQNTGQTQLYSNGDYGWRLIGKKPLIDSHFSVNLPKYTPENMRSSDGAAVSQMNFHMDTGKAYNYNQISKSSTESDEAQEFAQAAAKAHERYKQQQQKQEQQQVQLQEQQYQLQQQLQQLYRNSNNNGAVNIGNSDINNPGLSYYNTINKQSSKYNYNPNPYSYFHGNSQNDLITESPYFSSNTKDNLDNKPKQPFDHDKAVKNIVSIDVSNVVGNSESKTVESNGRYISSSFDKDQPEQNIRQFTRPVTDSFNKDSNAIYGFSIKTKADDYSSSENKQAEKQQKIHESLNYSYSSTPQNFSYLIQPSDNYQSNLQSSNIGQPELHRNQYQPQIDISSILKLSDIPYKVTQGLSDDALKLHNFNFDHGNIPTPLPIKINQNVGSHQLDVTSNLLDRLLYNKQQTMSLNTPELNSQRGNLVSTINGFKVANPFNVDLKLVADMLKGKPTVDNSQLMSLREQYTRNAPLNLDLTQLQLLLNNANHGNVVPINSGLIPLGNPYIDVYNIGHFPYQGVKYSRSQEEEESIIPIADSSNIHPIGAVVEQDESASEREVSVTTDFAEDDDDIITNSFVDNKQKNHVLSKIVADRHRHANVLPPRRYPYQIKHPKSDNNEPYPLLKPPPPQNMLRGSHLKLDTKHIRRRRIHKPKHLRVIKSEPLFEAGAEPENLETPIPRLLRPSLRIVEEKSNVVDME